MRFEEERWRWWYFLVVFCASRSFNIRVTLNSRLVLLLLLLLDNGGFDDMHRHRSWNEFGKDKWKIMVVRNKHLSTTINIAPDHGETEALSYLPSDVHFNPRAGLFGRLVMLTMWIYLFSQRLLFFLFSNDEKGKRQFLSSQDNNQLSSVVSLPRPRIVSSH